jgi:hypothetical protein
LNRIPLATHEYEPTQINDSPNRTKLNFAKRQYGGGITQAELANVGPNSARPGKGQELQKEAAVQIVKKVIGDTNDEIRVTTDFCIPSPEFQK